MPVRLLPGRARFAAKPDPIGSETPRKTIGIVLVWRCNAAVTGVDTARMTSGCSATSSSFASGWYRSASAAAKRCSMWTVRPSTQPKLASPSRNFANWLFLSLSSWAVSSNTPIRRIRSPCCARAASGHAAAEPPINEMKSRRLMCPQTERPNLPLSSACRNCVVQHSKIGWPGSGWGHFPPEILSAATHFAAG